MFDDDRDLNEKLSKIENIIAEVEQHDAEIRKQVIALGDVLGSFSKRAALYAFAEDFTIEEFQDNYIYGHLAVSNGRFYLAYRSLFDDLADGNRPPEEIVYSIAYPESWDIRWLRVVATKENIAALLESIAREANNLLTQREQVAKHVREAVDGPAVGLEKTLTEAAKELNYLKVVQAWGRLQRSVAIDPASAITDACSLVETTLKHILHDLGEDLPSDQGVTSLYGVYKNYTRKRNLHPEHGSDAEIRGILNGLASVVQNIGHMRTKTGDAHGKSQEQPYGGIEEARLAANAAGTVCVYLLRCHTVHKARELNTVHEPSVA